MASNKNSTKPKNGAKSLIADDELARLRVHLNKKREYIAILELELFNTRAALFEYNQLYTEHIFPLEQRLRKLRFMLFQAIEDRNGKDKPPEIEEPEEEPDFTYQDRDENGWRKIAKSSKKSKDPELEEKIRSLFRELAKRFHPDLTSDPEEKDYRKEVMTKVNQAYAKRDLKALEALAEQPDRPAPAEAQSREDEILMLQQELLRLDGVISELKGSIHHLEESPAMKLMLEARMQRRNGKDLLSGMQSKLNEQIEDLIEHLLVLGVEMVEELEEAAPETEPGD